jgi:ribosomal protein S18 acetylase RimI-like enzyme
MTDFALRPAAKDDLELTYEITRDAMRPYVEATWGEWNEEDQVQQHRASFEPSSTRLVVVGGQEAGLLTTEQEPQFLWLVKLYLLTTFRNQGLGSALLGKVVAEAEELQKPVRLRVLRANTSAKRFYLRHGFAVVGEERERYFMVRLRGEA